LYLDATILCSQVAWDEKFPEHAELADFFGFQNMSVSGSMDYSGMSKY